MRITPLETRHGIGRYRVGEAEVTLLIKDDATYCDSCRAQFCTHTAHLKAALTLSRMEHDNGTRYQL